MIPVLALSVCALSAHWTPDRVLIAGAIDDAPATDRALHARRGQTVRLFAVVRARRGRRARYFTAAPALRLRGRRIARRAIRPLRCLGGARFRWHRVEPEPHHVSTPPPNEGNPAYSNSVLFGPRHGRWLGYDQLEYREAPIPGATGPTLVVTRVTPAHPKVNVHEGLGTMRYRLEVTLGGGRALSSPGADPVMRRGISPAVTRVSFRRGDGLVGHLTSYFNVPNVFGSGGGSARRHQTELYQGADCADVIIGAARRAGARLPYSSVAGLKRHARPVTARLLLDQRGFFELTRDAQGRPAAGAPARLRFGVDVGPGDLMLIDYYKVGEIPRLWDHVAVVSADRGQPRLLDGEDAILHMGYLYGLTETAARNEGPAVVQFLRFKRSVRARFTR